MGAFLSAFPERAADWMRATEALVSGNRMGPGTPFSIYIIRLVKKSSANSAGHKFKWGQSLKDKDKTLAVLQ